MKSETDNSREKQIKSYFAKPAWEWFGSFTLISAVVILVFVVVFTVTPWLKGRAIFYHFMPDTTGIAFVEQPSAKDLRADIDRLQKKLDRLTPGGVYLVVNTTNNTFFLYQNKQLIREGLCSTGSYIKLEADDEKNWLFETPKGAFTIKGKITDPVWRKPDWAFVEEGLPVPPPDDASRYEYGVLGDYALSLGGGYLIHGTLYKRFLGQPVTHGCIRMNDEDLEAVYNALPIGSKVFIY